MPYISNFLGSDLACVNVSNYAPENVSATVATDFTFDVTIQGATIASVSVTPGDGGGATAASLVSGDQWTVNLTYASAGPYNAIIEVTDSTGEVHTFSAAVVVS